LGRRIRLVLNDAAQLVVNEAEPVVPSLGGTAAGSIRTVSTQSKARVRAGGAKAPYYPWLDFGGRVGKYRQVHRNFIGEGRYIYPKYRRLRDSGVFQEKMISGLNELGSEAGLDMSGG
jgi:hypothetical protein